ncbi:5'-nucleotidase C-terminal domain-containing protein [Carboxylicivirga sp. A043]|uniref:5'-nucleotidase C-terminal domain-containing protein n=1 Tax=Carboxylicivirga litoralis TaxID=2816963 RepID=UPI0021CB4374|nr:5'-nucleotidase [Carboxylicivirga sp. A043]MCU4157568.1 5'-nucleotidase C-terminal domain-containing protein [Carboxylicivirga sp. A043]
MKYIKMQLVSVYVATMFLFLACNSTDYTIKNSTNKYVIIDSLVGEDILLASIIQPYRDSLQAEMQKTIGTARQELTGGFPESLLSNFVTDLVREECNRLDGFEPVDVSVVNVKGLRIPLQKGNITVENIYQLMPFENEIVYLSMTKEQMELLFDFMASVGGDGISGASFGIKNGKAVNVRVNNQPLTERTYIVATSDYLADGGDHFEVFKKALKREGTGLKVRDAIIKHIKRLSVEGKVVNSELDKRIYHAE